MLMKKERNLTNLYFTPAEFRTCFYCPSSSFNDETIKVNYYNKWIVTRDSGNVQSHNQGESNLNSTINAKSDARTLTHDKTIKSPFKKITLETIKSKKVSNKDFIIQAYCIGTMVSI